jgi:quercetin dioxygenase-like cupin family protein
MTRAGSLAIVATVFAGAALAAQQSGFTRTPLQDQPISVAGHHGVTARVDISPGVESGRHMHPGEEFGYVLEGVLQLEIDGRAHQTFKAGDVFFIPAGLVHNGRNAGSVKTTFIGTYVVEMGKPLSAPAK